MSILGNTKREDKKKGTPLLFAVTVLLIKRGSSLNPATWLDERGDSFY